MKRAKCNWFYQQSIGYGVIFVCVLLSLKKFELSSVGWGTLLRTMHLESKFFSGTKLGIFGFLMSDYHHCYPSKWSVKPNICFFLPEQIFQEEYSKNEMSKRFCNNEPDKLNIAVIFCLISLTGHVFHFF